MIQGQIRCEEALQVVPAWHWLQDLSPDVDIVCREETQTFENKEVTCL